MGGVGCAAFARSIILDHGRIGDFDYIHNSGGYSSDACSHFIHLLSKIHIRPERLES